MPDSWLQLRPNGGDDGGSSFLNPGSSGGGGPAPTAVPAGVGAGALVLGSGGSGPMPVSMNLFATWEIDRSATSCVLR